MTEQHFSSPSCDAPQHSLLQSSFVLYLASASPRRAQLLETLGVPFTRIHSSFEEPKPTAADHANPSSYVEVLAREKAAACDTRVLNPQENSLVLAADTIVWHQGTVLGKPESEAEAGEMLRRLRGEAHQVFTGICLRHRAAGTDEYSIAHTITTVHFNTLSDNWIERYVATGEPMDKAGAYAAQGKGALLVERIDGDFWNVVGLPLATLGRMLETLGVPVESWWK
ncbi:MAG TPA: Maf family protein [Abditibacteriaceae bacterium]